MSWEGAPWTPRRWQAEALPVTVDALVAGRRGVVVACTGAGKSPFLAEVVRELLLRQVARRVVVTTPTQKLVGQLGATLRARLGEDRVGLFYADAKEADRPVIVACNASARRLAALVGGGLDVWVADEAHRTESEGLQQAQEALSPRLVLGLTATPFLSSARKRLSSFTEVFFRYSLIEAARDGVVVPWRVVPWEGTKKTPMTEMLLQMIPAHTKGYGFVNARNIVDAEQTATWLTLHGVAAAAVHSRQSPAEQERRLAALRKGWLRCVVYPNLLQEGFDEPGASWLALARDVKSRVRFVQEFGRVLRTHPGKTEAVILDPHGLYERFDLLTSEALGANEDDVGNDAEEGIDGDDSTQREGGDGASAWRPLDVQPLDVLSQWAAHLVQAAQLDGLLPLRFRWSESRRATLASPAQLLALKRLQRAARLLPEGHAELAQRVAVGGHAPSAGAAGDLLDVLSALRKRKGGEPWTPRLSVWLPQVSEAAIEEILDAGDLAAAGLVWSGQRAVVVVQGRRTLHCETRVATEGESSTAATIEALILAARLRPGAPIHTDDVVASRLLRGEITGRKSEIILALRGRPASCPLIVVEKKTAAKTLAFRACARERAKGARRAEQAAAREARP